jgi:two-component sensor histidine kinase
VQSLARQTARSAASIEDFHTRLQGRLIALSEGHDQLTRGNWEEADLREVLDAALKPYREEFGDRIALVGDRVKLHPRAALTLSMVFHELITNPAKYGALSNETGRLRLAWHIATAGGGRELVLRWREESGPRVASPTRRGFGTEMVERSIPAELGGRASLQFAGDGVICDLTFPLASNSESSPAKPERTARFRRRG